MSTVSATNLKHASSASNNIVLDASGNTAISGSATVGGVAVVTTTGTQTLTNKTLTSPVITGASVSSMASSVITSDTSKSATSTSVDFTGIPSWVKRITIMLSGVSTSGTSSLRFQLGDSGGIENTGYASNALTSSTSAAVNTANSTAGFDGGSIASSSNVLNGALVLTNVTSNTWVCQGSISNTGDSRFMSISGGKSLSDTLTQVRITTANGTDTFDAGSINIIYE